MLPLLLLTTALFVNANEFCPNGWISYQASCYYLGAETATYYQATDDCHIHSATLFVPDTWEEWEIITKYAPVNKFTWIGLHCNRLSDHTLDKHATWMTHGGMDYDDLPWLIKLFPNGHSGVNSCVTFFTNSLRSLNYTNWLPCNTVHHYICEHNNTALHNNETIVADWSSMVQQTVHPRPIGTITEYLHYTTVHRPTYHPTTLCPDGWFAYAHSCYYASRYNVDSWEEAEQECASRDAGLFTANSFDEFNLVRFHAVRGSVTWIGLHMETVEEPQPPHLQYVWSEREGIGPQLMPWLVHFGIHGFTKDRACVAYFSSPASFNLGYIHWYPCHEARHSFICEQNATALRDGAEAVHSFVEPASHVHSPDRSPLYEGLHVGR